MPLPPRAVVVGIQIAAIAAASAIPARADDTDYFGDGSIATAAPIAYRAPRHRTRDQKIVIGSLALGGVVVAGIGAHFNLDARAAAARVSADSPPGRAWSAADQDDLDRAASSSTWAITGYAVGGGLLIGALIALWRTDPGSDLATVEPPGPAAVVVPTSTGGVAGARWTF